MGVKWVKRIVKVGLIVVCLLLASSCYAADTTNAGKQAPLSLAAALELAKSQSNQVILADLTLEDARLTYEDAKANQMVRPSPTTMQQAENAWQTAQRNRELARIDLDMQVESAYYDVLRATSSQDLAGRSLNSARVQLDSTKVRYNHGMVSDVDLLAAETAVASAEAELNRADAALLSAKMRLNRILGRDLAAPLELVDEFVYEPVAVDLDAALAKALETRLELQQSRNTLELRKTEVVINDNPYTPSLTTDKSRLALKKAEIDLAEKELDIRLEILQSYNTLKETERRIPIQQKNVDRAKESLRISQVRYEAGVITSIDLIDAQRALFQAETQMIQAIFDYNTQLAKFARSTGLQVKR